MRIEQDGGHQNAYQKARHIVRIFLSTSMELGHEADLAWARGWGEYKGMSMVGKTNKDAKEALARVSKLTKAAPEGHHKLRHDAGSGH